MPKVFISYRRSDTTPGYASWIYDRLAETFGHPNIFMDIDSLPLGADFVEALERSLNQADVALILIGPHWLTAEDEAGARRLDDPDDFVRIEVAAALRAKTRVIPVLVDGARMPGSADLPEELQFLARRQGLVFQRHGGTAIRELIDAIREADQSAGSGPPAVLSTAPAASTTAPASSAEPAPERSKPTGRRGVLLAAGVVLVAAAAAAVVLISGGGSGRHSRPPSAGSSLPAGAIAVGNSPDGMLIRQGVVWVANAGDATITRIDEASGHVLGKLTYASHSEAAAPLATWRDALWIGDSSEGTIREIDPASGRMIGAPIPVHGQPCAITADGGSLWVGNFNGTVTRIVASPGGSGGTSLSQNVIPVAAGPKRMTGSKGTLWVANSEAGTVTRIDTTTGQVAATLTVGGHPGAISAFGGSLWLADRSRNTLTRVDPVSVTPIRNPIAVGEGPRRISGGENSLWIADSGDGTVTEVNARTGTVMNQVKVGGYPDALTVHDGVLWVAIWSSPAIQYQGPPGGVVRVDAATAKVIHR